MVVGKTLIFSILQVSSTTFFPSLKALGIEMKCFEKHHHAKIRAFQCARYFEEKNLNFGVDLLQSCKKILVHFTINVTMIFFIRTYA